MELARQGYPQARETLNTSVTGMKRRRVESVDTPGARKKVGAPTVCLGATPGSEPAALPLGCKHCSTKDCKRIAKVGGRCLAHHTDDQRGLSELTALWKEPKNWLMPERPEEGETFSVQGIGVIVEAVRAGTHFELYVPTQWPACKATPAASALAHTHSHATSASPKVCESLATEFRADATPWRGDDPLRDPAHPQRGKHEEAW